MTAPTHKPISKETQDRFKAYHKQWNGWGNLHLVLGNCNVKDKHVEICKSHALLNNDKEGNELSDVLMGMSQSQRIKLSRQEM